VENTAFGLHLSEYHTGYRAFSRGVLDTVNFRMNSDGFVFDQEIVAQVVATGFRIAEIPVPVRYFPEASSASFSASCVYGLKILWVVARYLLHRTGLKRSRRLGSIAAGTVASGGPARPRRPTAGDRRQAARRRGRPGRGRAGLALAYWTGRREHWPWRPEHLFLLLLGLVALRVWLAPPPLPRCGLAGPSWSGWWPTRSCSRSSR